MPFIGDKKKVIAEISRVRVMTYNICSGTHYPDESTIDLDYCAAVISKYSPDIVGIQEVHDGGKWGKQTKLLSEKLGYPYYYFGKAITSNGSDYGNGFMSKYPIVSAQTIVIPDPEDKSDSGYYETRCIIKAVVKIGDENVTFFISHFGLVRSEAINAVDTMLALVGENPERTVIMGDFNLPPTDSLIKSIKTRLIDTAFNKSDEYYTYIADNPYAKIDYIFVSEDATVLSSYIAPEIGSDHLAYISEIGF